MSRSLGCFRWVHQVWFVAALILLTANEGQAKKSSPQEPLLKSPLLLGRSPASVNPLLGDTQISGVKKTSNKPRWRLLGSCRQDVGMNQSQNGLGYANCNN